MNLEKDTTLYGKISAMVGAVAMITWLVPLIGIIFSGVAVLSGVKAYRNDEDGWPIAGITLGLLALVLVVLRSGLVYMYG